MQLPTGVFQFVVTEWNGINLRMRTEFCSLCAVYRYLLPSMTQPSGVCYSLSVVGQSGANVTVNNGSGAARPPCSIYSSPRATVMTPGQQRPVFVTPLSSTHPLATSKTASIPKVLLKAVAKVGKSSPKMFTIRNIDCGQITTCKHLKHVIKIQLQSDIAGEFDVGYVSGNSVISIWNTADVSELWSEILKGNKIVLWCDGLKLDSSDGDSASAKKWKS